MKSIKLKSSDDQMIEVSEAVAMQSEVIKNYVEAGDGDYSNSDLEEIVIPVPNVRAEILKKAIEWMKKKSEDSEEDEEIGRDWEKRYMYTDLKLMNELTMAANFLAVDALLIRCCQEIADMIADMSPEEVREVFGIVNDFTPEEEEAIRKQNAWAFESEPETRSNTASTSGSGSRSATNP